MWSDIVSAAQQVGCVPALGLVCLVQYVWHLFRQARLKAERDRLQSTLAAVEKELSNTQHRTQGVQRENRLLCDLLVESEPSAGLRRLLQAFVPPGQSGFAACFHRGPGWRLRDSVGIAAERASELMLEPRHVAALAEVSSLILDARQVATSRLGMWLQGAGGLSAHHLYLLRTSAVGDPLDDIIMTTHLPDVGGPDGERLRAAERLLKAAGRLFRRTASAQAQEQELRVTKEILELRSVVDLEFRSPQDMVAQFLDRLAGVCVLDHASVYMLRRKDQVLTRLARCNLGVSPDAAARWEAAEAALAEQSLSEGGLKIHQEPDLKYLGVPAPFACAITVPMRHEDDLLGILCLSGSQAARLTDADRELLVWSADYLLQTILRSADRASIQDRATRDALTGLANRHTFDETLAEFVRNSARMNRDCSLVLFDLDRFKQINDRHGHPAGDEALRSVSRIILDELRQQVRGTDHPLAARFGGEELAVLLPGVGLTGGRRIAEAIRKRIEQTLVASNGAAFQMTLSAGIAVSPAHGATPQALLAAADRALYNAKQGGRNRVNSADDASVAPIR